ncbi:MAG: histidinol-phosphate transaminase [Parvularculaceae bacterium]|nr:histidinol-phosphate transaminase [Parvularculaceae bacterium]
MTGPVPRNAVSKIGIYVPGKVRADGAARVVKLSANENALGASPKARAAYLAAADDFFRYPDVRAGALRAAVARKFDVEPERLIFGVGSDEIFTLACMAYLDPGDNAVQPEWGFAAWRIAVAAMGADIRSAPERDFVVDIDAILDRVDAQTKIVFLANPANPTGSAIAYSEVLRLQRALPEQTLLVLDGAYAEFARAMPGFDAGLGLARNAPNVLMTRTFSKLYGLAGLRVGWAYGPPAVIAALDRVRLPFNMTIPGEAAAIAALDDDAFVDASIAHVDRERATLDAFVRQFGVRTIPSWANFVTLVFDDAASAKVVDERLAARGVLVRGLGNYGMPTCLRVTTASSADMAVFRDEFERALTS